MDTANAECVTIAVNSLRCIKEVQGHLENCYKRTVSDDCGVNSESELLLFRSTLLSNNCKLDSTHIVTVFNSAQTSRRRSLEVGGGGGGGAGHWY